MLAKGVLGSHWLLLLTLPLEDPNFPSSTPFSKTCWNLGSHFYPRPVLAFGYCRCLRLSVCVSVRPEEELSPLQYHIKSLHIISRHYKSLLRSQIYHGYEELSTDKNYPIWRRQERRSKYAVQLASWQLRSNSPKTSVCVCGKRLLVRAITHHPFKLGSSNLDNRCKRPWLRSLLFCGVIDLDLQGQIELQSQNLPHFELVHAITHHQLKLQFPNLEQKCILELFRSLPILGLIEIDLQFNF